MQQLCWGYERVAPERALQLGLIDYCVNDNTLSNTVEEYVARLEALPVEGVLATKRITQGLTQINAERLDAYCNELFQSHYLTPTSQATFARFTS